MPFEFTLLTYQTETGLQASVLLKECLDKIGVICHVKPTEFTVLVDAIQKPNFRSGDGRLGAGTDPDTTAKSSPRGETRNYASYSNPQVDELYEKGRREFDPEKRAAIYGEIHNILWARPALHLALLSQFVLRIQQKVAWIQLQPDRDRTSTTRA